MVATHLRARALQAGAFLAVVGGILAAAPSVALANEPQVSIGSVPPDIPSGGKITLTYTVKNANPLGEAAETSATVIADGMTCSGACSVQGDLIPPGTSKQYTATLVAGTV